MREEYDPNIEKHSDVNHAMKTLTNGLYELAKKHKALSSKVIKYFKKCCSYVLAMNKGDEEGVLGLEIL